MRLHDLKRPVGANKKRKRISRGNGSGRGGKGQTQRTGKGKVPAGFEGGQMPMYRRMPKRGFVNKFALRCCEINLDMLALHFAANEVVDLDALRAKSLAGGRDELVRVLGRGEIAHAIVVRASHVSAGAREKIEAAGGRIEPATLQEAS